MFVHGKRREELAKFAPYARFQIPEMDTEGRSLVFFFGKLFEMFAEWADPRNEHVVQPHYEVESEGATGSLWINNQIVFPAKLFIYDGNNPHGWQGILIRDHLDLPVNKVDDVFRIADKFEEYLNEKGIPFERFNMKFPERQEVLVSKL